ncbi:MAG: hypothetical protein RLY58_1285 [Pseudomonadota bacterium]|jgi:hypothetical protein
MLNRDQLQELGRFKLMMRKAYAESVHVERFLDDMTYQSRLLDLAEESDNDELLMLSLTLRARLGRLGDGDDSFHALKHQYGAPEQLSVDDHSDLTRVGTRTMPVIAALSTSTHPEKQGLQASVDAAPPRRRGLLGALWGGGTEPTDANGQRYVASLR